MAKHGKPEYARSFITKIGILGEPEAGKNELARRVVENTGWNKISDQYLNVIGVAVYKRISEIDLPKRGGLHKGTFLMWDMTGQQSFDSVRKCYCEGAEGAVVVGDATRTETIDAMPKWANYLTEKVGEVPIIYAINKIDRVEQERHKELRERARNAIGYSGRIFLTSAKTGEGVKEPFRYLERRITESVAKRSK
jgi:small GTP-binding protein